MTETMDAAVPDDFRWLEEDADAAVIAWQTKANDTTVAELAASLNAARVAAAVNATFEDLYAATAPERFGDSWFRKVQVEGRPNLVLTVSPSPTEAGRVLVDPSDYAPAATITICHPSPDGTLLFIGISVDQAVAYRVLSVADGNVVREFPSIAGYALGAWAYDNSGFFYSVLGMKTLADGQVAPQYDVWWQPLSGEAELQPTELDFPFGWPVMSADGRWVSVLANQLRGGGERDTEFWNQGRMHRKQGTFDDMFAVIEDLHARGLATPERTGVTGSSNGGLLTCAVFTQRPDLIGAAVAQVPVCDLVNLGRDPVPLNIVKADYGDPAIAEDAAAMRAYSPVHRVRAGTHYPALLCDAGAADTTCPPWHARKMVASVDAANSSDRRIRLRVREGTGHNTMTRELFIERDVEELTFFYDELS